MLFIHSILRFSLFLYHHFPLQLLSKTKLSPPPFHCLQHSIFFFNSHLLMNPLICSSIRPLYFENSPPHSKLHCFYHLLFPFSESTTFRPLNSRSTTWLASPYISYHCPTLSLTNYSIQRTLFL